MTLKEKNELQNLACEALKKYFGFSPSRKQISLLKYDSDEYLTRYLLFTVSGNEEIEYMMKMCYNGNIRCYGLGYNFEMIKR